VTRCRPSARRTATTSAGATGSCYWIASTLALRAGAAHRPAALTRRRRPIRSARTPLGGLLAAGRGPSKKAVGKVGGALREVQQVLALFRAPGSDPRLTVESNPATGRRAPVKMQNSSAGPSA